MTLASLALRSWSEWIVEPPGHRDVLDEQLVEADREDQQRGGDQEGVHQLDELDRAERVLAAALEEEDDRVPGLERAPAEGARAPPRGRPARRSRRGSGSFPAGDIADMVSAQYTHLPASPAARSRPAALAHVTRQRVQFPCCPGQSGSDFCVPARQRGCARGGGLGGHRTSGPRWRAPPPGLEKAAPE